ncbi:MAG: outer membrane beta-barrel protein [bacterium]
MLRKLVSNAVAVCVIFAFCGLTNINAGNDLTHEVSIMIGQKSLDGDDWGTLDSQLEFGAEYDFTKEVWPVSGVFGVLFSNDDGTENGFSVDGSTREIYAGVKKYFDVDENGKILPYISGGLASIYGEIDATINNRTIKYSDSAIGLWLSGGLNVMINEDIFIGGLLRYSMANLDFAPEVEVEGGGIHFGLTGGIKFN